MDELIYNKIIDTWIGDVYIAGHGEEIILLNISDDNNFIRQCKRRSSVEPIFIPDSFSEVIEQIQAYLNGELTVFSSAINLESCTSFQKSVLEYTRGIQYGYTQTYGALAIAVSHPNSARAVGQALRNNPIPLIIPCHRVIGVDGSMKGYLGPSGIGTKRQLLDFEKRSLI